MTPLLAKSRNDEGVLIVILGFVTVASGNVMAIVTTPDGGAIWYEPIEDLLVLPSANLPDVPPTPPVGLWR